MRECMCVCVSRWSLWGAERGRADVGLWVAVCFLAKISSHRPTWKTTFARFTQSQSISQSFRVFISFTSRRDTTFFHFSKLFFIQNYRFLYHGDQKIFWWTSMQVAGSQLRNPPLKFRQERWLHIWRSISIQHVQIEAGLNSNPGTDSFSDKSVTLSMLIDLLTSTMSCRSTQVKIESTDLWLQEMFTFSEMLALVESESSFGAYVCQRRPGGSRATSDIVGVCVCVCVCVCVYVCVCHRGTVGGLSRCWLVGSCVLPGEDFFT